MATTLKPGPGNSSSAGSCVCDCRYEKVKRCEYHDDQECRTEYKSKCRKIRGPDV